MKGKYIIEGPNDLKAIVFDTAYIDAVIKVLANETFYGLWQFKVTEEVENPTRESLGLPSDKELEILLENELTTKPTFIEDDKEFKANFINAVRGTKNNEELIKVFESIKGVQILYAGNPIEVDDHMIDLMRAAAFTGAYVTSVTRNYGLRGKLMDHLGHKNNDRF